MRAYRTKVGPLLERPYFTNGEIERICSYELNATGLLPDSPQQIRVERFIEKRFGVSPQYENLPDGVLGFTVFGTSGVQAIVISRVLCEEGNKVSERRLNATLAHEGGHALLHAYLFRAGPPEYSLFPEDRPESDRMRILCREDSVLSIHDDSHPKYAGQWWEFQANRSIGGLLLPKSLVVQCVEHLLVSRGSLGSLVLPSEHRDVAIRLVSEVFDVNPAVARIRIGELYPASDETQLTL